MELIVGDFVAGVGITTGKYLGTETLSKGRYIKVKELSVELIHYLPLEQASNLRKLPSKATVQKYIRSLETDKTIDVGEIEGSRYRFFKEKLLKGSLINTLEVFHDLNIFKKEKKITVSEKKLFNTILEKLTCEFSHVLGLKKDKAEEVILNIGQAA